MSDTEKPCRSTSPNGDPCIKPRGHRKRHIGKQTNGRHTRRWESGVNAPARWEPEPLDVGSMSEADWMTWGRFL